MSMMVCSCGSVLVSDEVNFQCPFAYDKNWHKELPIQIPDKRTTTSYGIERNLVRKPGRLV